MKPFYLFLTVVLITAAIIGCSKDEVPDPPGWTYDPTPVSLNLPESFPIMDFDEENPLTEEGVALGRMLYYDPLLHPDETMACADCHFQNTSFTSSGPVLPHINLGWNTNFLWNGKVSGNIEDIMLFEVEDFFATDLDKFRNHADYPKRFYEAFGTEEITAVEASKAIAQFLRTVISSDSRYDKTITQGANVFPTEAELNGFDIFFTEKGDCFHCHGGILFSDNEFHNNGLDTDPSEHGLSEITGDPLDLGKFKSPTLRNIALTGPYMHDGRYETLDEVIDFYSEGVKMSSTIDPLMKQAHQGGIQLTPDEKSDLKAFLLMLTDTTFTTNPAYSNPF